MTTIPRLVLYCPVVVNILAFLAYGLDKLKAKRHQRRIPERTLLLLALIGGSAGAWWGMKVWHHKTRHKKFTLSIPVLFLLQTALAAYLWKKYLS
ncbi:MAG: DUF1294 domain-containing protein [Paraprevotella sp.]|nr:DUF1294 domain-containing protein [Paraprevotella sp.]